MFFLAFIAIGGVASAQTQKPAEITRVYLWDKPVTDSITYKGILPGTMHVVTVFAAKGQSFYALFDSAQYAQAQSYFSDEFMRVNAGRIVGYEYVVSYIGKFSLLTKKELKKLSGMQKMTAIAFNEKEKFTLMAQAPRTVEGYRDANGNILLKEENKFVPGPAVRTPSPTREPERKVFTPPLPPVQTPTPKKETKPYQF